MNKTSLPFLCLLCLIALAACDGTFFNQNAAQPPKGPPAATPITSAEPADVLREFINAWDREDYDTMHRLTASRSRELYPRQTFENRYAAVHNIIRFGGVSHTVSQVEFQGATAILAYDIIIESAFDRIEDTSRTLRMIQEGGWKIAWSPMDIFDGLSSQARLRIIGDFPSRANIYDRDGRLLAEEGGSTASLYVVQQDIASVDDCLATLAAVTRQQVNTLRAIFASYLPETRFHIAEIDPQRYLQFRESLELDCAILNDDTAFSKVLQYNTRSYYGHGIAPHLIGYIGHVPSDQIELWEARGYSETDIVGLAGIENVYETALAGRPQRFLRITDSGGTIIRELASVSGETPQPVTLTIDRDLQEITAQALADAVNYALPNWGGVALGGAIAAIDVNSGRILTLASYPAFDPHIFNPDTYYNVSSVFQRINRDPRSPLQNKALAVQYTPGSVYKIATLLAAAAEGIWTADQTFNCQLEWRGQERFRDALPVRYDWRILNDLAAAGQISMRQALASSCNPFFWEIGALMFQRGNDLQANYAGRLGFGRPTGLGAELLELEAAGSLANTTDITAALNNAIGQGNVTVTALQMAQATALIANGGRLYQPYAVSHIGAESARPPTLLQNLELDPPALDIVRQGMCDVITDTELGTAWFVFDGAPYTLCGKTGTAQTALFPNAWFVAYHPAENPQIALAGVMANSREGSEVVAPIIRRILDNYLGHDPAPFPEWWTGPYVPLEIQTEAFVNSQDE